MNTQPILKFVAPSAVYRTCCVLIAILLSSSSGLAEIRISPFKAAPLFAFPGGDTIEVVLSTSASNSFEGNVQIRVYQCSSATIMPIGPLKAWKKIELPSGQRTIETVAIDYPSVSSETIFQVHFFDDAKTVVGRITVHVLPRDLLKQLSTLCGKNPVGIYDPENQLKPMLGKLEVEFEDLEDDARFDSFHGNLLLAGPFSSSEKISDNLRGRISTKAKESCSVVWMLPPQLQVPFDSVFVLKANGSEVVLHDTAFKDLAHSASAQFTLLRSAQLALDPDKLSLSHNRSTPK